MAEVLKEHKWRPVSGLPAYPWNKWLDGQVWRIEGGVDFLCSPETFLKQAMAECHRKGIAFRAERINQDVVIQGGKK